MPSYVDHGYLSISSKLLYLELCFTDCSSLTASIQFDSDQEVCLKIVSKGLVLFAGLLTGPATKNVAVDHSAPDPRLIRLRSYFEKNRIPINALAGDFIAAADHHDLDWRLLPSISIIESGGGRNYRNNNVFGWQNCERRFPSIRAGIHIVAERIAHSRLYRDKDVDGILTTYNPNAGYRQRVKTVMSTLGPADLGSADSPN